MDQWAVARAGIEHTSIAAVCHCLRLTRVNRPRYSALPVRHKLPPLFSNVRSPPLFSNVRSPPLSTGRRFRHWHVSRRCVGTLWHIHTLSLARSEPGPLLAHGGVCCPLVEVATVPTYSHLGVVAPAAAQVRTAPRYCNTQTYEQRVKYG